MPVPLRFCEPSANRNILQNVFSARRGVGRIADAANTIVRATRVELKRLRALTRKLSGIGQECLCHLELQFGWDVMQVTVENHLDGRPGRQRGVRAVLDQNSYQTGGRTHGAADTGALERAVSALSRSPVTVPSLGSTLPVAELSADASRERKSRVTPLGSVMESK